MNIQQSIQHFVTGHDLTAEEVATVFHQVMEEGQIMPSQLAALLIAWRMKGETVDELVSAVQVLRSLARSVPLNVPHLVDNCGTGGDDGGLFNVSTAAAIVSAAGGAHVAKHGNRAVSSVTGSADVLRALKIAIDCHPDVVVRSVQEIGIGFMFAPIYHPAMKHVAPVRREIGVRTLFNLLGPLLNPAAVPCQLLGVYDRRWCRPLAEILQRVQSKKVMVVHSADGLDEISLSAQTFVVELKDGVITEYVIHPNDFALSTHDRDELTVHNLDESVAMFHRALREEDSAPGRMVSLNAGAVLYVSGITNTLQQGVAMSHDLIASGQAREKLKEWINFSALLSADA